MKVFTRGFNLYNQLNSNNHLLLSFAPTIEVEHAKSVVIQHSFSVIHTERYVKIYSNMMRDSLPENVNYGRIVQVCCNNNIVLVLNDASEIFKITLQNEHTATKIPKFTFGNDKIKSISCGETLNVAYTQNGKLYSIPEELDFSSKQISDLKTGREHCIILDTYGQVYTFGSGSRGQLGHGNLTNETSPKLVEALAGLKIIAIAAGSWHSAAVSADGDLYTWGWNGNGQLGLSKKPNDDQVASVMATPTVVDFAEDCSEKNVIKVACGARHTLVLLDDDVLYGSGWNKYKQLTNTEQENFYSFVNLEDLSNNKILELICGPWCSAVMCA